MQTKPDLTIVVVSYETRALLRQCLQRLSRPTALQQQIIVVDNASRDGSADMVEREFPDVELVRNSDNRGFAAANNQAFLLAKGRQIGLINPDALIEPEVIERAVRRLDVSPTIGAVGGRILGPDGTVQPSARCFPTPLDEVLVLTGLAARYPNSRFFGRFDRTWADVGESAPVDWVPGAFFLLRRDVLDAVGGFDERFFLYYEEVDLCRRIRAAGYEVWYWADCEVRHVGGASSAAIATHRSEHGSQLDLWRLRSAYLYYRKHHGAPGALAKMAIETTWHGLRALRPAADRRQRRARAFRAVEVARRAWRDTAGGRISPTVPWTL